MIGLKVVSMNVNGLNSPTKRRAIFDHLRKAKVDVYLLQETHSTTNTEKIWGQEWGAPAFFCNGSKSSRGVAILVSRDLLFTLQNSNADEDGRILCIDMMVNEVTYTLASIYAPTQDKGKEQLAFLDVLDELLTIADANNIIVGGDFNHSINLLLERNSNNATPASAIQVGHKLAALMEEWSLCDVWRIRNPSASGFTFRKILFTP